jgi:hypothetical protein
MCALIIKAGVVIQGSNWVNKKKAHHAAETPTQRRHRHTVQIKTVTICQDVYKITQRQPAVGSSSPSRLFAPLPPLASSSSTTSCGFTVICTTFGFSLWKRQSDHQMLAWNMDCNTCSVRRMLQCARRSDRQIRTFEWRAVIQHAAKVYQPYRAR